MPGSSLPKESSVLAGSPHGAEGMGSSSSGVLLSPVKVAMIRGMSISRPIMNVQTIKLQLSLTMSDSQPCNWRRLNPQRSDLMLWRFENTLPGSSLPLNNPKIDINDFIRPTLKRLVPMSAGFVCPLTDLSTMEPLAIRFWSHSTRHERCLNLPTPCLWRSLWHRCCQV